MAGSKKMREYKTFVQKALKRQPESTMCEMVALPCTRNAARIARCHYSTVHTCTQHM